MLRNAALVLLAVCSGHFKESITKARERSGTDFFSFVGGGDFSLSQKTSHTSVSVPRCIAARDHPGSLS